MTPDRRDLLSSPAATGRVSNQPRTTFRPTTDTATRRDTPTWLVHRKSDVGRPKSNCRIPGWGNGLPVARSIAIEHIVAVDGEDHADVMPAQTEWLARVHFVDVTEREGTAYVAVTRGEDDELCVADAGEAEFTADDVKQLVR